MGHVCRVHRHRIGGFRHVYTTLVGELEQVIMIMSDISFPATRVVADPEVMFRTIGDESMILDLKSERYLGFDKVGTRMWAVLTEAPTIEAAFETLLCEYEVEALRLREDLESFINRLVEQQLVQLLPQSGTASAE